jgi:ABC-type multidrug transport system fused ATPase/permease subunit
VIPQDPVLFSGTIRSNLDPFNIYSDSEIWEALERSNLIDAVRASPLGLEMITAENGENFSSGQKQLLCLARAMLKKAKIVILDEATASVDLATDEFIQNAIRDLFEGATVLTIAHRLNTVADYDKILVLGNGRVLEEGSPKELLEEKGGVGVFAQMVAQTGPVNEALIRKIAWESEEARDAKKRGTGNRDEEAGNVGKQEKEKETGVQENIVGSKYMGEVVVQVVS